jgi:1,4-dihydroxy-2-naphthoyl-CoA hydrolase
LPVAGYVRGVVVPELPDSMPGLDTYLGMRIASASGERVVLRWQVRPELCQPHGLVHGGTYCTAVEAAASIGAALWFSDMAGEHGRVVGVSNQTDFYRAVTSGDLTAEALPVHRGRTQQVWRVRVSDDRDRLVAEGQVRLQNLNDPHRGPGR